MQQQQNRGPATTLENPQTSRHNRSLPSSAQPPKPGSRKIIEGEWLLEAAERGMRVWSLTGEYDLATADGRRHFREDMVSAASESESESDKLSERIRHGKVRRTRRGRLPGGVRGYGMPGLAPKPDGWMRDDPREMVPEEQVEAERVVIAESGWSGR